MLERSEARLESLLTPLVHLADYASPIEVRAFRGDTPAAIAFEHEVVVEVGPEYLLAPVRAWRGAIAAARPWMRA